MDSQSKHVVGAEAANKTDMPTLPQPVVTPSTGNQFVTGFGDGDKTEESSGDPDATDPHQLPGVDGKKEVQEKEYPGMRYCRKYFY